MTIHPFDDLQPQHAIPNFLLHIPAYEPEEIWNQALKPVLQILLSKIHDDPSCKSWLERRDKKWRQQLPASPGYLSFGRIKALTHIVLYGPYEDRGTPPEEGKLVSLDHWPGVTQRWSTPTGSGR